ncbi:MAG TPA: pyruvate kinase, partial [Thiomicrospira sp.]|nr:pyruvate kinase [Thiomicrospira sp.]
FRGVYPTSVVYGDLNSEQIRALVLENVKSQNLAKAGDLIVLTRGRSSGQNGGTNQMEIIKVP